MVLHGLIPQSYSWPMVASVMVPRTLTESLSTKVSLWMETLEFTYNDTRRGITPSPQLLVLWSASAAPMGTYHTPLVVNFLAGYREEYMQAVFRSDK